MRVTFRLFAVMSLLLMLGLSVRAQERNHAAGRWPHRATRCRQSLSPQCAFQRLANLAEVTSPVSAVVRRPYFRRTGVSQPMSARAHMLGVGTAPELARWLPDT